MNYHSFRVLFVIITTSNYTSNMWHVFNFFTFWIKKEKSISSIKYYMLIFLRNPRPFIYILLKFSTQKLPYYPNFDKTAIF